MRSSEESGHPLEQLQPDFEAEGVDMTRMLESAGRLRAAVDSEKSDQGERHPLCLPGHSTQTR